MSFFRKLCFLTLLLMPLLTNAVSRNSKAAQSVMTSNDVYWTSECSRTDIPQSPVNLKPPFTYMDFDAQFNFQPMYGGQLYNDAGHNLKMSGDFGNFEYKGKLFNSYEIYFKAPSEHTFGLQNKRFPLEMQIASISAEGVQIMLAIMFSQSQEDGDFISSLGFGEGLLQHLAVDQYYQVQRPIDISSVIPTDNKFFIYEGTKTTPPCEPALWLVAFQTYKASERQLNDFPKLLLNQERELSQVAREVYTTFYPKSSSTQNTADTSSTTTPTTTTTPIPKTKSANVDSFEIIGDDTPYDDEIYPFVANKASPRPLRNEDYIVVTSPGDTKPYLDFLKLNKNKVDDLLDTLENKQITANMAKAEAALGDLSQTTKTQSTSDQVLKNLNFGNEKYDFLQKKSPVNLEKTTAGVKQTVLSAVRRRGNRDPSSFFSEFTNKKSPQRLDASFLQLGTNLNPHANLLSLHTNKKNKNKRKTAAAQFLPKEITQNDMNPKMQTALNEALSSAMAKAFGTDAPPLSMKLENSLPPPSLHQTHSIDPNDPSMKQALDKALNAAMMNAFGEIIPGVEPSVTFLQPSSLIQTASKDATTDSQSVVYGPKVPAATKQKLETELGRGEMAYNKNNEWDGVSIQDTSEWPDLCKYSPLQSPISIDFSQVFKIEPSKLTFAYENESPDYIELRNDGYKLLLLGDFGPAVYGDHVFYAEEVHFHHPSEHTFGENMDRADMEIQIIHRDNFGLTIAAAILLQIPKDGRSDTNNEFLDSIGFSINDDTKILLAGESRYIEASKVDLNQLVQGASDYIGYTGSLTSPPCSENVQWFVFNKRIPISQVNIDKFKQVYGKEPNIRGVQPLNNRELRLF